MPSLVGKLGILAALVHRNFRIFWSGHTISVTGQQMFIVVQAWLVYDLTGSALQLGLLGLARALPSVFLGLAGGVIADKVDQRRLLIWTEVGTAVSYLVLASLTITEMVAVWHIHVTVFLTGGLQAFNQPSRQAIFPHLIDRRDMMSAVALNSTVHPGTRIFAPIVAGFLIDTITGIPRAGAAIATYFVAGSYLIFAILLLFVRMPPIKRAVGGNGIEDLANGMRFILDRRVFRTLIGMSFVNAFFGMSHIALMPIFVEMLTGQASGSALGLLYSAGGIGGLTGAIVGGSLGSIRKRGWLVIGGGSLFGVSLIAFAFSPIYWLTVGLEWLSALMNQIFMVTGQSTMHLLVPDDYRGRVMGFWGMTHTVMQPMGMLGMGAAASVIQVPITVALGAGVVTLFALIGAGSDRTIRNLGVEPAPSAAAPVASR